MSSLSFVRVKGDSQVYANIQDDAGRNAWYQPVSPEALTSLGITDKNIKYAGKADVNVDSNGGLSADKKKVLDVSGLQQIAGKVGTDLTPASLPTYATNYDPTTPDEEKHNLAVQSQMQNQDAAQQTPAAGGGSPISAAGFDDAGASPAAQNQPYTIQKGDTLSALAKKNGTTVAALMAANPSIKDANKIMAGASLNLPGAQQQNPGATDPTGGTSLVKVIVPGTGSLEARTVSVSPDSMLAQTYGVYDPTTQKVTGGTSPTSVPGSNAPDANGTPGALPPIYENALASLETYINTIVGQGGIVNPELKLTPDQINKFMDQAKTEMAPYHAQQISQAQTDLVNNLKFQAGEEQSTRSSQDAQNDVNQESLSNSMAERGLAQSGIRELAKKRLDQQYGGVVESTQRRFGKNIGDIGNAAERNLGSANLPNLAGVPAVEGQNFSPTGGQTGSLESSQEKEVATRAGELAAATRNQSASLVI